MIVNKSISIILSGCLFLLLMLILSSVLVVFFSGSSISYIAIAFVVAFYFIARMFYSYLRNDELYKNTKQYSSDKPGEKYITKGSADVKKTFVIIWVIVVLLLAAVSLWLYSFNAGLV